ncbi:GIP, partial [Symbiodinium sp. KB8]
VSFATDDLIPARWNIPPRRAWPRQRSERKSILAETDVALQRGAVPKFRRAKLAVVVYTVARVIANLTVVFLIPLDNFKVRHGDQLGAIIAMICDGLVRPVVTGMGVFLLFHRPQRLSDTSQLHLWTRWALYCLASCHLDIAGVFWQLRMNSPLPLTVIIWEGLCNVLQMHMTNVKIHALGLQQVARVCKALTGTMAFFWVLVFAITCAVFVAPHQSFLMGIDKAHQAVIIFAAASTILVIVCQLMGLCCAAGRALRAGRQDADLRHTACLLYVNSMLQLLGPMMSLRGLHGFWGFYNQENLDDLTFLTLDISFQVLNVLLLSGLVGPQRWQDPMAAFQKLADLQGFGLSSKRIAFTGHVNDNASDCIVSFPGKYSEEWDQAVSVAKTQEAFSLACVFLTDSASGLGVHCDNPDDPGECWCRAIYGHLPASTYISVVDMRPEMQESQAKIDLKFKLADAEAMGQYLVIRDEDCSDIAWQRKLADAEEDARARCAANHGRAPWGCRWFEDWRRNVHKAVELKQALHVFYFEDRKGHGKMRWEELPSDEAKALVRQRSGLGASQTAEVAYLDKE